MIIISTILIRNVATFRNASYSITPHIITVQQSVKIRFIPVCLNLYTVQLVHVIMPNIIKPIPGTITPLFASLWMTGVFGTCWLSSLLHSLIDPSLCAFFCIGVSSKCPPNYSF